MTTIQDKYVPCTRVGDSVDVLEKIPFGGDLLTEERAINIQKAFLDGDNSFERLEGLPPKFEDWHAKKNTVRGNLVKNKSFILYELMFLLNV